MLGSILDPETPPSPRDLAARIDDLNTELADARAKTAGSRLKLTQEATKLHETYRRIIESSIRILEQTIHGSVARGTKAKVDYLATVAEGMNKKLQLQQHQLTVAASAPELEEAVEALSMPLDREVLTLKRRTTKAEEQCPHIASLK